MTASVPAWVPYAALGASILALLVSIVATRVAYLSYRASGPRLRLSVAHMTTDPATRRVVMTFLVTNEGRGEVTIEGFSIVPYGHRKPVLSIAAVEDGPALPARLAGSASMTWHVDVLPIAREYEAALQTGRIRPRSSWPSLFHFAVSAGNGKRVRDRFNQFDAARLIANAFPTE